MIPRKYEGETVVILATGPSLNKDQKQKLLNNNEYT